MRNGLPFSKPRVRLHGDPGEAQAHLGEAYGLLYKVRQVCERSGVPVFAMSRDLPGGGHVTAAVVGAEEIVSVHLTRYAQHIEEQELLDKEFFYMDYGWLKRSSVSVLEVFNPAEFSLESTDASNDTYDTVWAEELLKKQRPLFQPHSEEQRGRSYGKFLVDLSDEDTEKYLGKLKRKLGARPLVGGVTGLLRALIKGVLGRRLSDGPDIDYEQDFGLFNVVGLSGIVGRTGVMLFGQRFYFVEVYSTTISLTPLKYPERLQFLVERIEKLKDVAKLACATYVLAYSSADSGERYFAKADKPLWFTPEGWFFSNFSNEFVTSRHSVNEGSNGVLFETQRVAITYDKESDSFFAKTENSPKRLYTRSTMPFVWEAVHQTGITLRLTHKGGLNELGQVALTAFYSVEDKLLIGEVGCRKYEVLENEPDDYESIACGEGKTEKRIAVKSGLQREGFATLTGGAFSQTESFVEAETGSYFENETTSPLVRFDSSVAYGGAVCHEEVLQPALWPTPWVHNFAWRAQMHRTHRFGVQKFGSEKLFAIKNPLWFSDTLFFGSVKYAYEAGFIYESTAQNPIRGYDRQNQFFPSYGVLVRTRSPVAPDSFDPSGGNVPLNETVIQNNSPYKESAATSELHVCASSFAKPHKAFEQRNENNDPSDFSIPQTSLQRYVDILDRLDSASISVHSFHGEGFWYVEGVGWGSNDTVAKPEFAQNTLKFNLPIGFQ